MSKLSNNRMYNNDITERNYAESEEKSIDPASLVKEMKPTGMHRAKSWNSEVENSFRYQLAGYRDRNEYNSFYPLPEYWDESGLIKFLRSKKTGYYMYFRKTRECEDKYLNRVIIYEY
uniref:Meiosis expressed gene 1 protein homolog n=1 Tax=Chromulina nebulosa TaxID=96789 RepID=A0A7S0SXN5_9STRA|mmetsp:Transcript_4813/g.4305  ORF Transcript_4813/g.4305 Transcript_4813/m.4305 type:complete len:118 (+) Transcript_4813:48-401(+)